MFESNDFEDILSEENFSIIENDINLNLNKQLNSSSETECPSVKSVDNGCSVNSNPKRPLNERTCTFLNTNDESISDQSLNTSRQKPKRKRKFPGPAGLLADSLQAADSPSRNFVQLSQNFRCSQTQLPASVFEDPPWLCMVRDLEALQVGDPVTLSQVKSLAAARRLANHRVGVVAGVLQSLDCSSQDPAIVLRDTTAEIQCTLHRAAWDCFESFLVPQHTVMLLSNTTVLTTGTLKNNYLNITLKNIVGVYCDQENTFENKPIRSNEANEAMKRKYSVENVDVDCKDVIVIRKIDDTSERRPATAPDNSYTKKVTDDDFLAHTLLDGIDANELFEDFS